MDSTQVLVTVLGAGGGGAALLALINGLFKWMNGTAGREKARNADMKTQRDEAWDRADREARKRRKTEEYASQLRRDCTEHGATELRPWPDLNN